jgi:hypothetical protein
LKDQHQRQLQQLQQYTELKSCCLPYSTHSSQWSNNDYRITKQDTVSHLKILQNFISVIRIFTTAQREFMRTKLRNIFL